MRPWRQPKKELAGEVLRAGRDALEQWLVLGASRWEATHGVIQRATMAALTPTLNHMSIMGLVSLPSAMSGQLLGGSVPIQVQAPALWLPSSSTCTMQCAKSAAASCQNTRVDCCALQKHLIRAFPYGFLLCLSQVGCHAVKRNGDVTLADAVQAARYQGVVMLLVASSSGVASTAAVLLAVNSIVDRQHRIRRERLVPRAPGSAGVANWIQAQVVKVCGPTGRIIDTALGAHFPDIQGCFCLEQQAAV